jgi:hypothetical protein
VTYFRAIPLSIHGVIEIIAAPALIAAPFLLGFVPVAGAISMGLGTALLGLALSTHSDSRTIPLSAHAGFDYVIGFAALFAGVGLGIATGDLVATAFLVVFGLAHIALTASTRFSVRGV